ncbi:hypothetical protein [Novacetimonas hansenii]|uniref:hypothetical protein n=1 Tax=Novacetimonas hansenii TaxID=436 RepID=UPI000A82D129|nr:hypothetical protein [Novacetimonas hansenii]
MPDVKSLYPARFYARYDTSAAQPTPVTGWYDVWGMKSISKVPPASDLVPLTADEWSNRLPVGHGVHNGRIVECTPVPPAVPLDMQAQRAHALAVQWVYAEYGALNEPTPADWVAYIRSLKAIINGTDTSSSTLPAAPNS